MGLFSSYFVGNLTSSSWSPWKGMLQWNRIEIFCVCEVDNHKKKSIKYSGKDYFDFLYVVVTINNHPRWKLTYGRSLVRWLKTPACYSHTTRIIWAAFCSILSIFPPTGPDRSAGGYDLYHHTWSVAPAHASAFSHGQHKRKRKGRAEAPRARRTLRKCRRLRIFMSVAFIMEVQM